MPRAASPTEARDEVLKEVLENTNKPRYCYMGFAPPLCIGDEYTKAKTRTDTEVTKSVLVPFPKKGNGPDAMFSTTTPLCVGDPHVDRWKRGVSHDTGGSGDQRPRFKPAGKTPDSSHRIEYISAPAELPKQKDTEAVSRKGFLIGASKGMFQPVIEYVSSDYESRKKLLAAERKMLDGKFAQLPPFRTASHSGGFGKVVAAVDTPVAPAPVKPSSPTTTTHDTAPFRPGGGHLPRSFPEHIPDPFDAPVPVKSVAAAATRSSWRTTSVPLLSSPNPSIAFNPSNLFR